MQNAKSRLLLARSQWRPKSQDIVLKLALVLSHDAPIECASCASHLNGLIRSRNWQQLYAFADRQAEHEYSSLATFTWHARVSALFKKYTGVPGMGFDPERTALDKFHAAEQKCALTNAHLSDRRKWNPHAQAYAWMREYVRHVLGETPDYEKIYSMCGFASGASIGVGGDRTNLGRKLLASKKTVTPYALPYVIGALRSSRLADFLGDTHPRQFVPAWVSQEIDVVAYNKISFVPKTAKTHRSIAVEPLLNGFVQKGIDLFMRDRLKRRAGIDLTSQERNQRVARSASHTGLYATVDLSAASDSLSIELARELLPERWYTLLNDTRSHNYRLPDGSIHRYNKFVSMGNGFCFPLQTLFFAAACWAASEASNADFTVYGDDIVVRREYALYLIELLSDMGFTTNSDKTFLVGPFRESCGADWYEGQFVRAAYIRDQFDSLDDIESFHNTAKAYGYPRPFLEVLRSAVPDSLRLLKPYLELGGGAFSVEVDEAVSSRHVLYDRKVCNWSWLEQGVMPRADNLADMNISIQLRDEVKCLAILGGSHSQAPLAFRRKSKSSLRRVSRWPAPLTWYLALDAMQLRRKLE